MIIKYNDSLKDARILSRSGNRMRIALENSDDAVELSLVAGRWMSEERIPVSFEFLWAAEIPLVFAEGSRPSPPPRRLCFRHGVGATSH